MDVLVMVTTYVVFFAAICQNSISWKKIVFKYILLQRYTINLNCRSQAMFTLIIY